MPEFSSQQFPIAVAQPIVIPGDVRENVNRMRPLVADAVAGGARMVLFSETALTSYDHKFIGIGAALALDDPSLDQCAAMTAEFRVAIVTGFYERSGDVLYNSMVAFLPDGRRILQRKNSIINWERRSTAVRSADRHRAIFEFEGMKFAILICADGGMPGIYEELAAAGVDCVLAPTAGCGDDSVAFHQHELKDPDRKAAYLKSAQSVCFLGGAIDQCLRLNMGLACCNQQGWVPAMSYFHPGHSGVIDRTGELTALIPGRFVVEHLRPQVAVGFVSRQGI